jgi:methionine-S-sulfoxide reductase/methionine-R-sulfoxide reductase
MNKHIQPQAVVVATGLAALLAAGVFMAVPNSATGQPNAAGQPGEKAETSKSSAEAPGKDGLQIITFGSGCFWCTEAVFDELKGVESAVSGYSGGQVPNPTYEQVCTGQTGHAEVIQVTYDPKVIAFKDLLAVFWQTHDPTTLNAQGPDHGTQYRSAVFYHTDEQRKEAEFYMKKLDESGAFRAPIVTEITKFEKFYPAEGYHQEYFAANPEQGYCRQIIRPKVNKFKKAFADLLKTEDDKEAAAKRAADPDAPGVDPEKVDWSKVDWRKRLSREEFNIMRLAGTERAFTGEYWDFFEKGAYKCRGCGLELFESDSKFDSECGWPSFDRSAAENAIVEIEDNTLGMSRIEVRCRRCDAHLGHIFNDGPTETGMRYCINSPSIKFVPDEGEEGAAKKDDAKAAKD